jgi:hypothetical protein
MPRRFPLADEKIRHGLAIGIVRRGMLFDLGVDRLPSVGIHTGSLFTEPNRAGDVIRASRLARMRNFAVGMPDVRE